MSDAPDWEHLGPIVAGKDEVLRLLSALLEKRFGKGYLETFGNSQNSDVAASEIDALFLLLSLINPAAATGFGRERDERLLDAICSHIKKIVRDTDALSVGARLSLGDFVSKIPETKEVNLFDKCFLEDIANAISSTKRELAQRPKLGRTDKDWRQIIIAHRCYQIWEYQNQKAPKMDIQNPDATPFGSFVYEIFQLLNLQGSVGHAFKHVKAYTGELPDRFSGF